MHQPRDVRLLVAAQGLRYRRALQGSMSVIGPRTHVLHQLVREPLGEFLRACQEETASLSVANSGSSLPAHGAAGRPCPRRFLPRVATAPLHSSVPPTHRPLVGPFLPRRAGPITCPNGRLRPRVRSPARPRVDFSLPLPPDRPELWLRRPVGVLLGLRNSR